jgi:hypothetical protein
VNDLGVMVASLSKKVDGIFDSLRKRIDQVSVIGESETHEYVKDLKSEIGSIRSELPKFVRKEDMQKMVLQPVIRDSPGAAAKPAPARSGGKVTEVGGIEHLVGKPVTVDGRLSLLKTVGKGGVSMNWYRLSDPSGESIVMSGRPLKEGKARMKGTVKKTSTGSVYILLDGNG